METFYEHVPKEALSKDYGGKLESLSTYHSKLKTPTLISEISHNLPGKEVEYHMVLIRNKQETHLTTILKSTVFQHTKSGPL